MSKRYIVLLQESTEENDNKFLEFIKSKYLGWWHWLPNSWLLSDATGNLSAPIIRDAVRESYSDVNSLVIELKPDGDTWSGFGPSSGDKDMFKWIKETWNSMRKL